MYAVEEPTSSLDPKGRRELKELLRQIPLTKLIATHDLELVVELCSRVIVLDKGIIVAEGPTAELLSNEELMLRHGLVCMAVAPGMLWHRAAPSSKLSYDNQFLFLTASSRMYATIAGPPKAVTPSRRSARKIRPAGTLAADWPCPEITGISGSVTGDLPCRTCDYS